MTALVLLPGLDGTGDLFQPFIDAVDNRIPLVVVRYPNAQPLGYDDLVDYVIHQYLPKNQNFMIVGESFSGPIAIKIASKKPHGLLGTILCATFVRNPYPSTAFLSGLTHHLPFQKIPVSLFWWMLTNQWKKNHLFDMLKTSLSEVSDFVFAARLQAVSTVDATAQLAINQLPMLYLRANQDRIIPRRASEMIQAIDPNVQIVSMDAPHFLLQTQPKAALVAMQDFMKSCVAN